MDAQKHYWETFVTLKRNALYIGRYQAKVEAVERNINMCSAVAASSAIGGWVIWQHFAFGWAAIVAAAQVLSAIRPQLPYRSRLAALTALAPELEALALAAETDWLKVCRGYTTEDETYQLAMALKRKEQQATQKNFKGSSLPDDRKLLELANDDAQHYMLGFSEE